MSDRSRWDPMLIRRGLTLRPRSNCILSSTRLASLGISMRATESALPELFQRYAAARHAAATRA